MKRRVVLVLMIMLMIAVPLTAGGVKESPIEHESDTVYVDSYQRVVRIPAEVTRVVSLGPNITEAIFALGLGDNLVGRTDYCDYPAAVFDIASVGTITDPNIEMIIELDPDLVIGSIHTEKETLDRLEDAGITTVGIYTEENFAGVYHTISDLGKILRVEEEADRIVTEMQDTISYIEETVKGAEAPSVYYVVGFGEWGDFTAGGDTFINDIITLAGGKNIAEDVSGWSYSLEKIIENDPDIIICSEYWGTPEMFASTPSYEDLRAVTEGNLYPIDNNMIDRQGVRNAAGALVLAKIFHPELF